MHARQDPSAALLALARLQSGVVTGEQASAHGLGRRAVQRLTTTGYWCSLGRSVFGVGPEPPGWSGLGWAGTLMGGGRSRLGGEASLHLHGLLEEPPDQLEVWSPRGERRLDRSPWRFRQEGPGVHSTRTFGSPPHLGVEDTVLDLAACRDPAGFSALLISVVQRRRTTPARLREAAERRSRLPHRRLLEGVLADVAEGAESPLERAYLVDVERAHGLPRGSRQHRRGRRVRDVTYEAFGLVVELDSRWHEGLARFVDMERDNESLLGGELTLRYGWTSVVGQPCRSAGQVARLLTLRGWTGLAHRCPRCRRVPTGDDSAP